MERRLATILSADVVGYSHLIREDEASTLTALKAHHEEKLDPKFAQYLCRTVKLMEDIHGEFSGAASILLNNVNAEPSGASNVFISSKLPILECSSASIWSTDS